MTDKADSSLARMLAVLDLYNEQRLALSVDAMAAALQVSQPTAYRYVRLLAEAGLLQRQGDAQYTLGPRVTVLDHLIRRADPVLAHALPWMKELVACTGLDCVASALYGEQMIDIHREFSGQPAHLSYGRGRPRPLFLGAAPKVVLAQFSPASLRRLHAQRADEVAHARLPADWPSFRRYFAQIRKQGSYFSSGELEPTLGAVAAPLLPAGGRVLGALSLVTTVQRLAVIDVDKLAALLTRAASEVSARLHAAAPGQPPPATAPPPP